MASEQNPLADPVAPVAPHKPLWQPIIHVLTESLDYFREINQIVVEIVTAQTKADINSVAVLRVAQPFITEQEQKSEAKQQDLQLRINNLVLNSDRAVEASVAWKAIRKDLLSLFTKERGSINTFATELQPYIRSEKLFNNEVNVMIKDVVEAGRKLVQKNSKMANFHELKAAEEVRQTVGSAEELVKQRREAFKAFKLDVTRKLIKMGALNERVVEEFERAKLLLVEEGQWLAVEAEVTKITKERADEKAAKQAEAKRAASGDTDVMMGET